MIQPHLEAMLRQWAEGLGTVHGASVKTHTRAIEKLWRTYSGRCELLLDLARSAVIFESVKTLHECFKRIKSDPTVSVLQIKNRLDPHVDTSASGGYRNFALNILISDKHTKKHQIDTHVCELQLELSAMSHVKNDLDGHKRYVSPVFFCFLV